MNTDKPTAEQETKSRRLAVGLAVVAGIFATVLRIVPHPTNFSSVGALSLFGGARISGWQAYLVPLGVMIFSDQILWALSGFDFNYSLGHPSRFFVYASFMIYVWIGRWLQARNSIGAVALAGTLGGLQFFVLTNFCVWLFQPFYFTVPLYSQDLNGLLMCFAAALPFYQGDTNFAAHPFALLTDFKLTIVWTVLGDILFTSIYLLVHAKLVQRVGATDPMPAPAANA